MSLLLQVIVVAVLVSACALYSLWRLLSGAARLRALEHCAGAGAGLAGLVREAAGAHARRHRRAAAAAARPPLARLPGIEHLAHFAVGDALLVVPLRVAGDDAAPEAHRHGVAQVFGDLPAPGETTQDQLHRGLPDAQAPPRARDEELRHAVLDARLLARGATTASTRANPTGSAPRTITSG